MQRGHLRALGEVYRCWTAILRAALSDVPGRAESSAEGEQGEAVNPITTEGKMIAALREMYPAPEYALIPQVRNSTGFTGKARTADALVMGLWPSRGIHLHGIEIKVSRQDWLKEKAEPEKAEAIAQFCDFWWLAVGSDKVALVDEVPLNWGLIAPGNKGLKVVRPAVQSTEVKPITRAFLAALMRKLSEGLDSINQETIDEAAEVKAKGLQAAWERSRVEGWEAAELKKLQTKVASFERAAGFELDRYGDHFNKEIGEAIKVLRWSNRYKRVLEQIEQNAKSMLKDVKESRDAIAQYEKDVSRECVA